MNSDAIKSLCLEMSNKKSKNVTLSLNYWPPNGNKTYEKHL